MEATKYVIKATDTDYYRSGTRCDEFTKDPLKARSYKTPEEANKVKDKFEAQWRKNGKIYCFLTGKSEPFAKVKKITVTIVEEDA